MAAVGGANGGLVIPEEVTYNIYNVRDGGYRGDLIATVTGGKTEYVVPDQKTAEGNQRYAQWAISAKNKAGESGYGVGSIIVGNPTRYLSTTASKVALPKANSLRSRRLMVTWLGKSVARKP